MTKYADNIVSVIVTDTITVVKYNNNTLTVHVIFICMFRFRQGFKQFFSFVPCINVRTGSLIRREVVTSRYSYSGSPDAHYRIVRNGNRKPRWAKCVINYCRHHHIGNREFIGKKNRPGNTNRKCYCP